MEKERSIQDDDAARFLKLERYLPREIDGNTLLTKMARDLLERIEVSRDHTDTSMRLKVLLRHGEGSAKY